MQPILTMKFLEKRAHSCRVRAVQCVLLVAVVSTAAHSRTASAQNPPQALTLAESVTGAVERSPDILAAREAVAAARGREIQAGARSNPTIGYSREQTGSGASSNSEDVFELEQSIEIGGTLGASHLLPASRCVCSTGQSTARSRPRSNRAP